MAADQQPDDIEDIDLSADPDDLPPWPPSSSAAAASDDLVAVLTSPFASAASASASQSAARDRRSVGRRTASFRVPPRPVQPTQPRQPQQARPAAPGRRSFKRRRSSVQPLPAAAPRLPPPMPATDEQLRAASHTVPIIETLTMEMTPMERWRDEYRRILNLFQPLCYAVVREPSATATGSSSASTVSTRSTASSSSSAAAAVEVKGNDALASRNAITQEWLIDQYQRLGYKVTDQMLQTKNSIADVFYINRHFFREAWCAASLVHLAMGLALDRDTGALVDLPFGFSLCRDSPKEKGWYEIILICTYQPGGMVPRYQPLSERKGLGVRLVEAAYQVAKQRRYVKGRASLPLKGLYLKAVLPAESFYVNRCGFFYDREGTIRDPVVAERKRKRLLVGESYVAPEEHAAYNRQCTDSYLQERTGGYQLPVDVKSKKKREHEHVTPPLVPAVPEAVDYVPSKVVKLWKPL